jgi:predicted amidohydrolase YtcJ
MDGHTAWANKALLMRAGITKKLISGLDAVGRGYLTFANRPTKHQKPAGSDPASGDAHGDTHPLRA